MADAHGQHLGDRFGDIKKVFLPQRGQAAIRLHSRKRGVDFRQQVRAAPVQGDKAAERKDRRIEKADLGINLRVPGNREGNGFRDKHRINAASQQVHQRRFRGHELHRLVRGQKVLSRRPDRRRDNADAETAAGAARKFRGPVPQHGQAQRFRCHRGGKHIGFLQQRKPRNTGDDLGAAVGLLTDELVGGFHVQIADRSTGLRADLFCQLDKESAAAAVRRALRKRRHRQKCHRQSASAFLRLCRNVPAEAQKAKQSGRHQT